MKKYTSFIVLFLSIILISNISCKKEENNVDLITAHGWVEQSLTFEEDGQDVTADYHQTFGDISVNFNADGTYSVTSVNEGVLTSGTWEINDSQTVLTATDTDGTVFSLTIVSITDSLLNMEFTYTWEGWITITVTIKGTFTPAG